MTDQTLLGGPEPAELPGYGPIPAAVARNLIADALERSSSAFARRLFTDTAGRLVAAESPRCNAPIRHLDHIQPVEDGGPTSTRNGEGLCERGNHTKQHPDWHYRPDTDAAITITTPTGHSYPSRPPPIPGVG